jgi:hypothetical protein
MRHADIGLMGFALACALGATWSNVPFLNAVLVVLCLASGLAAVHRLKSY